jgi:hypothetical protein
MASPARNPRTDAAAAQDVRALALASGLGRLAIGAGLAVAPGAALAALGFREHGPSTVAVARIAGGRDIALGAATLLALGDAERLRLASIANAAVDAGDTLTFAAALAARDDEVRGGALRGVAAAVPAALAGAWVALRLR